MTPVIRKAFFAATFAALSIILLPACNNGGEKKEGNTADTSQFKKDQWADTAQTADTNKVKKDQWADTTKTDNSQYKKDQWADTTKK